MQCHKDSGNYKLVVKKFHLVSWPNVSKDSICMFQRFDRSFRVLKRSPELEAGVPFVLAKRQFLQRIPCLFLTDIHISGQLLSKLLGLSFVFYFW